jgi:outer membrane biosynthesis protein TonB
MSPRKAQTIWQHRFNLTQEKNARLHEHLVKLAETGDASDWIIATLDAALKVQGEYIESTPSVPTEYKVDTPQVQPEPVKKQAVESPKVDPKPTETKTEPAKVPKQSDKEFEAWLAVKNRKAAANEKHPIVNPLRKPQ